MTSDWQTERTWQRWLDEHYQIHPRPQERIDAIAEITFLTPDEGGRSNPPCSGYRGQFYYDGHDWDANQIYATDEWVQPGDTVETILQFLSPQAHRGRIHAGMEFLVREGNRTVGRRRLTWVDAAFEEQNS